MSLESLMERGEEHRKRLQFLEAAQCFQEALPLASHDPRVLYCLADSLRGLGRFREAEPYWNEVLEVDPHTPKALSRAGDCFLKLGQLEKAEALFQRAVALHPEPSALHGLARLHRQRKDFAGALGFYQQVLEKAPEHGPALLGLGDTFRGLGQPDKALQAWQGYLERHPLDASVHARVADAYKKAGLRHLAIAHYLKALSVDAKHRYALMGLGDLYHREKRYTESLTYWEPLLALDQSLLNVLTMVGNIHRNQRRFAEAAERFRAALKVSRRNAFALFGLADSLRGLGQFEAAAPIWDQVLESDPHNPQVLSRAADCFFKLGQLDKAEGLYLKAMALGFDWPALHGQARVHRHRREFLQAIQLYETILARTPHDQRTQALLREIEAEARSLENRA